MKGSLPKRSEVKVSDEWSLSSLFKSEKEYVSVFSSLEKQIDQLQSYKGRLAESVETLKEALDFFSAVEKDEERLGVYAFLSHEVDVADTLALERLGNFTRLSTQVSEKMSYIDPELLSFTREQQDQAISSSLLKDYKIMLEKTFRFQPHVLSEKEETLLAGQGEFIDAPVDVFSVLTDSDFKFGSIETPEGKMPLSHATFSLFLKNKDRSIRKAAFNQFYSVYEEHANTLGHLLTHEVKKNVYNAKIRHYSSAREQTLFHKKVPASVYDGLIDTVGEALPTLHSYYDFKRQQLGLDKLAHYDVYVPLSSGVKIKHTYEQAADVISSALAPLGDEYVQILSKGFMGGWVDRYENEGKRSGAFSEGIFTGHPHILLNFYEDDIRDVFTMAHEGGHAMHSYYSAASQPFSCYNYTIFEAEVASTFNEQLLGHYFLSHDLTKEERKFFIGTQVDDFVATIFRQTMFAEYERDIHAFAEAGQPLTPELLRKHYRELLVKYFSDKVLLEEKSDLEGLRIPHFYMDFYVYQYATGLAAAIALSERVLNGGDQERDQYLSFLKSGGSKYPLESLSLGGVDMSTEAPVKSALVYFEKLLEQYKALF